VITVHGASDDLIEIDGDIVEEFGAYNPPDSLIAFSDGTVLRVVYSAAGIWRITPVATGSAKLTIDQVSEAEPGDSDLATLAGDVSWVVRGSEIAHREGASR
jgi:hypothetical protein